MRPPVLSRALLSGPEVNETWNETEQQSIFYNQYCKHPQSALIILTKSVFLFLLLQMLKV